MLHNSSVSTSHASHHTSHRKRSSSLQPWGLGRCAAGAVDPAESPQLIYQRGDFVLCLCLCTVQCRRVRRRKNPSTPRGLTRCRRTLGRELLEAQQRSRLHETHGFLKSCVSSRRERWNFGPGPKSEISRSPGSRSEALRCSLESDFVVS